MSEVMVWFKKQSHWLALLLVGALLIRIWTISGYQSVFIDTDLGRDLKEISNIQAGNLVWLGPWLGPGLHASSSYYYLFYPAVAMSDGQIKSMIDCNLLIAVLSLGLLGILATKAYRLGGVLLTSFIGLLPMITSNVLHPGNGYTYIFFILLCLSFLWFKTPLFLGSGAAGMAVALHPASGFLPLLLFAEWWQRGKSWKTALVSGFTYLLPLAPLIAFEIITKGYVIRSFLARPSTNGISLQLSLDNAVTLSDLLGMKLWLWIGLIVLSSWLAYREKQLQYRVWLGICLGLTGFTFLFDNLLGRYLFGVALLNAFVIGIILIQKRWSQVLLFVLLIALVFNSPLLKPLPPVERNLYQLESVADQIVDQQLLNQQKKVAVVAVMTAGTEVPQADDYRFLLRNRGYSVVETTDHQQAEQLLLVIEVPDFNWQKWSTWELESFGTKEVTKVVEIDGMKMIVFERR